MKLQCSCCLEELDLVELGLDDLVTDGNVGIYALEELADVLENETDWRVEISLDLEGSHEMSLLVLCPDCQGEEKDEMKAKAQEELDALKADLGEEAPSAGAVPSGGCRCCCAPAAPQRVDPEEERKKALAKAELDALNSDLGE